jgi:hypothetical protein
MLNFAQHPKQYFCHSFEAVEHLIRSSLLLILFLPIKRK